MEAIKTHPFGEGGFHMMKVEIISTKETIATHGGNLLVGELLARTELAEKLTSLADADKLTPKSITTGDVALTYTGLLCQAQPEFEAAEQFREDEYFAASLGIKNVPSCSTLRQRMDFIGEKHKDETIAIIMDESIRLLRTIGVVVTPCYEDYAALDVDVSPFDNSNTKKEGVSWTYKKFNGYAPIFAYLGEEGYCVGASLREGSQHCQKDTPEFLRQAIKNAKIATKHKILVRMDSGNDAAENIAVMQNDDSKADFIIKRNPRQESAALHFTLAAERGRELPDTREGKRVFVYENEVVIQGCPEKAREINFVTQRIMTPDGQLLIAPDYELESYSTSLKTAPAEDVRALYHSHGTSEQFHSEIKTDLDLERLPSGKFATNEVVLAFGIFAYNLLRIIGQESLKKNDYPPTAHKVKRRRIRTVIDRYITLAVKFVRHARAVFIKLNERNPWLTSFRRMYAAFTT
jgi:hypothetical protein